MSLTRLFISALALCAMGAVVIANAAADTVRIGNLIITVDGQISPKKLPRKEAAPITLKLSGSDRHQ